VSPEPDLYRVLFAPQQQIDSEFRQIAARYRRTCWLVRCWRALRRELNALLLWRGFDLSYHDARACARQLEEET
jgi:hypothetical protein